MKKYTRTVYYLQSLRTSFPETEGRLSPLWATAARLWQASLTDLHLDLDQGMAIMAGLPCKLRVNDFLPRGELSPPPEYKQLLTQLRTRYPGFEYLARRRGTSYYTEFYFAKRRLPRSALLWDGEQLVARYQGKELPPSELLERLGDDPLYRLCALERETQQLGLRLTTCLHRLGLELKPDLTIRQAIEMLEHHIDYQPDSEAAHQAARDFQHLAEQ